MGFVKYTWSGRAVPLPAGFPAIVTVGCISTALLCDPAASLELGGPGREGDRRLRRLELEPQAEAWSSFPPASSPPEINLIRLSCRERSVWINSPEQACVWLLQCLASEKGKACTR